MSRGLPLFGAAALLFAACAGTQNGSEPEGELDAIGTDASIPRSDAAPAGEMGGGTGGGGASASDAGAPAAADAGTTVRADGGDAAATSGDAVPSTPGEPFARYRGVSSEDVSQLGPAHPRSGESRRSDRATPSISRSIARGLPGQATCKTLHQAAVR